MESDSKGEFRKLSNDAVNRKYRRRSPVVGGGSSSSEGSPVRKRSSSPIPSRKDDRRHKDDYLDRDSSRNRQGRSGESHRQSSRSSRNHHKHDDYLRHTDDADRGYSKLCSHTRGDNYSNNSRRDNDHRSRDHPRDIDKYYRDRYEDLGHRSKNRERETSLFKDKDSSFDRVGSGRRYNNSSIDNNRSRESDRFKEYRDSRDRKSDRSPAYEESRSNRNESNSRKDSSVQRLKEADLDGEKYIKEERKNYEDRDKMFEHRNVIFGKGRESPAKKSKFSGMDQSSEQGKDGLNRASAVDGKLSLNSKQGQDPNSELALEQGVKDSDIDAAKIAAMKAAELDSQLFVRCHGKAESQRQAGWSKALGETASLSLSSVSVWAGVEGRCLLTALLALQANECWHELLMGRHRHKHNFHLARRRLLGHPWRKVLGGLPRLHGM